MSSFDPIDFQPNSVGVMVVRVIRLKDIIKALGCTEDFAQRVVCEIRGKTSADGEVAFVLPSQLAAWAYQRAGKREEVRHPSGGENSSGMAGVPFKTMLVGKAKDPEHALRIAAASSDASPERTSESTTLKSIRDELKALKSGLAFRPGAVAVTAEQAAQHLGCGRTRVFALLREGKLEPSKKTGRRTMITVKSIEAWLLGGARETAKPDAARGASRSGRLSKAILRLPL